MEVMLASGITVQQNCLYRYACLHTYIQYCYSLFSCLVVSYSLQLDCSTPGFPVYHQFPEFSQTYVHWVGDAIQPSYPLLALLHLPAIFLSIRVFSQASWLVESDGQSIGASASASVLPMNIQCWFHLGLTGWISFLSKGLSRVFPRITVQRHQFFSTLHFLLSSTYHFYCLLST